MSAALVGALALLALAFAGLGAPAPASAQQAPTPLRVYVVVLDGLRPFEVNATLTPNLYALKQGGTWYEQARAVFIAETLPNHAAMMTGVLPERNGIVGNKFSYPEGTGAGDNQRMQEPELLQADTLTTRLEDRCGGAMSTAGMLSKEYLWRLFDAEPTHEGDPNPQRRPDFYWDPQSSDLYIGSPDDHAPDIATMNEAVLPWLQSNPPTPHFAFINLGDIDRAGHIDELAGSTQGGLTASRTAALADTDEQIGNLIGELQDTGAWDETVLIFTSDHGFDWSLPNNTFFMYMVLGDAGYSQANDKLRSAPIANGGAGMIYVTNEEDIAPIARILDAHEGVDFVATRESVPDLGNPTLAELGMDDPNTGDVVLFTKPGWRVGDDSNFAIPGNHGHAITQHSTLFVTGGHPVLDDTPESVGGETVYDPGVRPFAPPAGGPGNVSVAPTVAALFGIGQPAGGYDRSPLYEAFENHALTAHEPCRAATVDDLLYPRPASATPLRVPLVSAYAECSEPDSEHAAPLTLPSCSATRRESELVTTSSVGKGSGLVLLRAIAGDELTTDDEADLAITTQISDVRAAGGSDYAGRLLLRLGLRITDGASGPPAGTPATVQDTDFSMPVDCTPTSSDNVGSRCSLATTADTLVPGFAQEGMRAVMSTPAVEVQDPGADGSITPESGSCPPRCGSGDERVFLRQGLFTP